MEDDRARVDLGVAADIEESHAAADEAAASTVKQPKKRFVGRRAAAKQQHRGAGESGAVQGMS